MYTAWVSKYNIMYFQIQICLPELIRGVSMRNKTSRNVCRGIEDGGRRQIYNKIEICIL